MATEQVPLLFFRTRPGADPAAAARALLDGSVADGVIPLDPDAVLELLRKTREFARLKVALPAFSFDNPRVGAGFEGTAATTHLEVRFLGDFDRVARPLFDALISQGLTCYSVWDKTILTEWPAGEEPVVDGGFAARMARVIERKTRELRESEPDEGRRTRVLAAYVNSPEFRAEMAAEGRREKPGRGKRAYADLVNCYARWKDGRPSAAELAGVRKLDPKFAAMSLADLRGLIGDAPRLLLLTAAAPQRAEALRREAERHGVSVEEEPP